MTDTIKFDAELKEASGTGSARAVRRGGKVPCVMYGGNEKELMFTLPMNKLDAEIKKGGFRTKIVEINLGGKTLMTLPKAFQLHPVTDAPEHVDFLRIGKDTIVNIDLPIKLINEDKSPGLKRGGVVNVVHRTVPFQCHPSNIPHHIEVDIGQLEIGHTIHISAIKLPEGITPVEKSDFTVVSITGRTEEVEQTAAPTAEATTAAGAAASPSAAAGKKEAGKK
jgi:large subunit ribosomal protein L25